MYSYLLELRELVIAELPVDAGRTGIFGHSMGGHGALVMALRNPELFRSVSAFAPIAAPSLCPWGEKAFTGYLGADHAAWQRYDASELMRTMHSPFPNGILIDQGLGDKFLASQLRPEVFESACTPGRPAPRNAAPRRLRPWLLFHLDLHGRPPALPPREPRLSAAARRR